MLQKKVFIFAVFKQVYDVEQVSGYISGHIKMRILNIRIGSKLGL